VSFHLAGILLLVELNRAARCANSPSCFAARGLTIDVMVLGRDSGVLEGGVVVDGVHEESVHEDDVHEELSWQTFGDATRELSRMVVASGFEPEIVVAIARGGLLPAGAIAYGLGVKNCGALNIEFYTGIGTVLTAPEVIPPALDLAYLSGRRILLVDDVADSGHTLRLALELLDAEGVDARSATIYTKPSTVVRPDYSWRETSRWIDFPWSAHGSVVEEDALAIPQA